MRRSIDQYESREWMVDRRLLVLEVLRPGRGLLSKMSSVCRPHLQTSAEEEVDLMSTVCKKKTVCFFIFCSLLK
ncbi:hypothetical protein QVD17_07011 [Tagetes erecta]|uniref:Uncharacterized protein n=1 Tax=Tagetes erecta TaxID=13708 RepID=A0AAD8LLC8_TARER|nr:hypothetical protein QVD17_07011 [Tagetes erecta]